MTAQANAPFPDRPVFLHAGWRSRGTWVWAGLRQDPRARGFYEPLHEAIAGLTPAAIAPTAPQAPGLGPMAPYWREFGPLLRVGRDGPEGFLPRFACRRAFAGPGEDPELVDWIGRLVAHARAAGQVAVLRLCNAPGRAGLLRAAFPEALHLLLLRRPDAQWASTRRQAERHDDPTFLLKPVLMLAANSAAHPVRQVAETFALRLPVLDEADPAPALAEARRLLGRLSEAARYRVFLAWWMAGTLAALRGGAQPVDTDMLTWSAPCRQTLGDRIAAASGLTLRLESPAEGMAPAPLDEDQAAAQGAALGLLQAERDTLPPDGYTMAWNLLASGLVRAEADADMAFAPPAFPFGPARVGFANPWARRNVAFSGRG